MSWFSDFLADVDSLPDYAKLAICAGSIVVGLVVTKHAITKPWLKIVKASAVEWDDYLHRPLSNRLNLFVVVGGIQISMSWITSSSGFYNDLQPFFSAIYILLATSICSVSVKHLVPVIMEQFQEKGSVTVSGSNSLVTFFLRFVLYFAGLYFALNELGIELFGILASLAVFSLIIGLAIQQTLGSIVNSFLLSIDRPFEVGDRIEIDGTIGTVVSVGILSTKILDRDERLVVIPNNAVVSSTLVNHARGGGDGIARRISVVIDIGVDYREDNDHVKYNLLEIGRKCPYTLPSPEPRVLLNELSDFSKVFRLYTWVEDYSEEWVARDWLLKTIDIEFANEDINIPYPTTVELSGESDSTSAKKLKSQKVAKKKMTMEDQRLKVEREKTRAEITKITEKLKDAELSKKQITDLEFEARKLENQLNMFDTDDD
ncbi:MAG: mechanosensitive ion channel [Candidatus Poseidoniaceae archaeon]|nr:mechanosensitive ion channel [Candidatus Poseidoniaceae archaeon]